MRPPPSSRARTPPGAPRARRSSTHCRPPEGTPFIGSTLLRFGFGQMRAGRRAERYDCLCRLSAIMPSRETGICAPRILITPRQPSVRSRSRAFLDPLVVSPLAIAATVARGTSRQSDSGSSPVFCFLLRRLGGGLFLHPAYRRAPHDDTTASIVSTARDESDAALSRSPTQKVPRGRHRFSQAIPSLSRSSPRLYDIAML